MNALLRIKQVSEHAEGKFDVINGYRTKHSNNIRHRIKLRKGRHEFSNCPDKQYSHTIPLTLCFITRPMRAMRTRCYDVMAYQRRGSSPWCMTIWLKIRSECPMWPGKWLVKKDNMMKLILNNCSWVIFKFKQVIWWNWGYSFIADIRDMVTENAEGWGLMCGMCFDFFGGEWDI